MNDPAIGKTSDLAGWLFADLLLALAILFTAAGGFGATIGRGQETPTPGPSTPPTPTTTPSATPTATAAPTPPPTPTPTPTPKPTAVHLRPICWELQLSELLDEPGEPERRQAEAKIKRALGPLEDKPASIVMTFGGSGDRRQAERLAREVNTILARDERFRDVRDDQELMRTYIYLDDKSLGKVWIEIWLDSNLKYQGGPKIKCP